jgi:RNA polymerase sigma-70 factor (ECF subfamily)
VINGSNSLMATSRSGRSTSMHSSIESLYRSYGSDLLRFLSSQVGDLAEDALMETFAVALDRFPQFASKHPGAERAWLFSIAVNVSRNMRRSEYGSKVKVEGARTTAGVADQTSTPMGAGAAAPTELRAAINQLPTIEREILLLVALADLSIGDAAKAAGIAPITARGRLFRARRRLLKDPSIRNLGERTEHEQA